MLEVKDLEVTYRSGGRTVPAVRGVDLTLDAGQTLGLAGESGSGKSTLAMSLLRLLPAAAKVTGQVLYQGEDLLTAKWSRMRAVRWAEASVVFQGAMTALNPVHTIGDQLVEPILLHGRRGGEEGGRITDRQARARAGELLESVGVPARRMRSYPHEFSGGQRQRIMIAMALACRPNLIIADEPTTALDVMVQAQILDLLSDLVRDEGIGVIMISHDLSVLGQMCDRLAVMYAGELVESGPSRQLLDDPRHPYTRALSRAFPTIGDPASRRAPAGLPGDPPDPAALGTGCPFAARCPDVHDVCTETPARLVAAGPGRLSACLRVLPDFPDVSPHLPESAADAPVPSSDADAPVPSSAAPEPSPDVPELSPDAPEPSAEGARS
ncbi:oligopeptide/dipeptide ABC transporter ATP-binding protein [Streptomyces sp. NPDC002265]|uniref:ABC transporter ATP-binding protein n=1 Tax=Streptomyces sp. NPDC002265 TaxID=3154415 RepID=UPI00333314C8